MQKNCINNVIMSHNLDKIISDNWAMVNSVKSSASGFGLHKILQNWS